MLHLSMTLFLLLMFLFLDLVLGFEQTTFSVLENIDTVNVNITIFGGKVDEVITVQFSAISGTALSNF